MKSIQENEVGHGKKHLLENLHVILTQHESRKCLEWKLWNEAIMARIMDNTAALVSSIKTSALSRIWNNQKYFYDLGVQEASKRILSYYVCKICSCLEEHGLQK